MFICPRKDLSDIFCCSEWNNSEKKSSNFHFVVSNLKPSKGCQWGMFLAKRKPKYNAFVCHETNRVQNSTVLIQRRLLNRVLMTTTVLVTFVVLFLFHVVTLTRSFFNYHPRCNDIKQFHVCSSVLDQFWCPW